MQRREDWTLWVLGILVFGVAALVVALEPSRMPVVEDPPAMALLSDPFLQYPTATSVRVVWFTEFPGTDHRVLYGEPDTDLSTSVTQTAIATTRPLSRTREDGESQLNHPNFQELQTAVARPVWRHEAVVEGLTGGQRYPYRVVSITEDGDAIESQDFTLAAAPLPGQPLKILLTSDHQLMPMTPANLQQVEATVGRVDAVFLAGDLVNVPDRASEWFDDARGNSFFPSLQGRADAPLTASGGEVRYRGGELIQHAPLFPALGNHEVMGRYSSTAPLNEQYNDPVPRERAIATYRQYADLFNPAGDDSLRRQWIINNSFNSDTYEEIFTLPVSEVPNPERPEQTSRYYAITFGDVRLISLNVTQIWRSPRIEPDVRGRYQEREADLGQPQAWGYGQHIFEPIRRDSLQYQWLEQELASDAFRQAPYKIVMLHHPVHSLGDNIVPPFSDPVPVAERWPDGSLKAMRYAYPQEQDQILQDLLPLLESAGVQLVFYGHSHLWNRFLSSTGVHYLESSNVGNTYGAYLEEPRLVPSRQGADDYGSENYAVTGDPNGLSPVFPTLDPDSPPYVASNEVTVFSILDTASGEVSSYRFDTRTPSAAAVKFDEFFLRSETQTARSKYGR